MSENKTGMAALMSRKRLETTAGNTRMNRRTAFWRMKIQIERSGGILAQKSRVVYNRLLKFFANNWSSAR
jgi:hypothetical protein